MIVIILPLFCYFPVSMFQMPEWLDCVGLCASKWPLSHHCHVDGDIASGARPRPFALIGASPRPPKHCLRSVWRIRDLLAMTFVHSESARPLFVLSRKHTAHRRHRTDCAALFPTLRVPTLRAAECIAAEIILCVCLQSFSSDMSWANTQE